MAMLDDLRPFEIKLPLRGYDDLFDSLVAAVPPGDFYDHSRPIVPWGPKPVIFQLLTDIPGIPINIEVNRVGDYHPGVDQGNLVRKTTIAPTNTSTSFQLTLGRGINQIVATENISGGRTTLFEVVATSNALIFEPFGRELFKSINRVTLQRQALYSPYSTRLLDQVIRFQELLPTTQSLKTFATKMLVRGTVHFPGKQIGTKNLIEAFVLNTPIFVSQRETGGRSIERTRIKRVGENQAGMEAHVWVPNLEVTRWLAFIRQADSIRQHYSFLSVEDDLVQIRYKGAEQSHRFDYDNPAANFLTNLSLTQCFNGIEMFLKVKVTSNQFWCAWTYPFDYHVRAESAIGVGRLSFDLGIPFDSDPLDPLEAPFSEFDGDPIDPYTDGWVGWSLTGRFELDALNTSQALYGLDTSVAAATLYPGDQCVYDRGPYTQNFNTLRTDVEIPNLVTASGNLSLTYVQGLVDHLDLDLPVPPGVLVAGTPVSALVKYSDQQNQTNSSGAGTVQIQESNGGALTVEVVSINGYEQFMLTPTKAGQITWSLSDGTYSGVSQVRTVVAGPFADLTVSAVGPQVVGVPFNVTVQAVDAYGNPVTATGIYNSLVIEERPGFPALSLTPNSEPIVQGGPVVVSLTFTQPGTGQIRFKLGAAQQDTNIFTVT